MNFGKYYIGQNIINKEGTINKTVTDKKVENIIQSSGKNCKVIFYKYKCNICGFDCSNYYVGGKFYEEYWIEERFLEKNKCRCCSSKCVVTGINDIATTHPQFIDIFKDKNIPYIRSIGTNKKEMVVCPECKTETLVTINKLPTYVNSFCKACSDGISYPNKFMYNLLKTLNIKFIGELSKTTFDWCLDYRYDFYLPDYKLIIEMDGGFHYQDKKFFSKYKYKETKEIDNKKDLIAYENGIRVIRIDCNYKHEDCFEYVKNSILNTDLINILNIEITNEDFERSDRLAYKSNIITASNLYSSGYDLTSIANIMKLSHTTILYYIKKADKLGLCKYIPNRDRKKSAKKKPVYIIKDGVIIGEHETSQDLSDKAKELYGTKLTVPDIIACLKNRRDTYKGFSFKYKE